MVKKRKSMVAGNWKMNGNMALLNEFDSKLQTANNCDIVICPPSAYLSHASTLQFAIGAQDISQHESGAHTGDISSGMLQDLGIRYVILGHSERRQDHGESNDLVAEKVERALNDGLVPICCIGEPLSVRESGELFSYVQAQIDAVLERCGNEFIERGVLAYEPIWAIGTGKTASPEQAQEVHAYIRAHLLKSSDAAQNMKLLYGGSVNANNAKLLFAQSDIDGGLIGGASLKIEDFNTICQAASL